MNKQALRCIHCGFVYTGVHTAEHCRSSLYQRVESLEAEVSTLKAKVEKFEADEARRQLAEEHERLARINGAIMDAIDYGEGER